MRILPFTKLRSSSLTTCFSFLGQMRNGIRATAPSDKPTVFESQGVARRAEVSRAKWKVGWKKAEGERVPSFAAWSLAHPEKRVVRDGPGPV